MRGKYLKILGDYYRYFDEMDIYIIKYEDLFGENSASVISNFCDYLGVAIPNYSYERKASSDSVRIDFINRIRIHIHRNLHNQKKRYLIKKAILFLKLIRAGKIVRKFNSSSKNTISSDDLEWLSEYYKEELEYYYPNHKDSA